MILVVQALTIGNHLPLTDCANGPTFFFFFTAPSILALGNGNLKLLPLKGGVSFMHFLNLGLDM